MIDPRDAPLRTDEDDEDDDEPAQCYYTGRGPCGDCRNPTTNEPMNCFGPRS